jgi:hypothetical protein
MILQCGALAGSAAPRNGGTMDPTTVTMSFRDEVLASLLELFLTAMSTAITFGFGLIQSLIQLLLFRSGLTSFGGLGLTGT